MKSLKPSALEPLPFTQVNIADQFWAPRMKKNEATTIALQYKKCKESGRLDVWSWKPGMPNEPHIFWDSDVAKWIEAASYGLTKKRDPELEKKIDDAIDNMANGQMKDGYLNSRFTRVEPEKRWTNLRDSHELYCAGNLMEASIAYYQATGKRKFLDIVTKYTDYIDKTFGPRPGQIHGYCGHPEIELALVKLAKATGNSRYLKLAEYFVNERGRSPYYFDVEEKRRKDTNRPWWLQHWVHEYCQSHKPLREQDEVVGHAVRAMYIYSGMAAVAAETGDATLLPALKKIWSNLTTKRMHVTGGVGPVIRNEGFTFDYDLPNENAYDETCANIGFVLWAHRMLHLDPNGAYADIMERALYNSVISGVSLGGDAFFYANPLAAYPGVDPMGSSQKQDFHYRRSAWFGCACCPPNVARILASFGGYAYSHGPAEVRVNLYVAGQAQFEIQGKPVTLEQKTNYPWDGQALMTVRCTTPARFSVSLRIPGWCRGSVIKVNGKVCKPVTRKGYATLARVWKNGDRIQLSMPMPVERIEANPHARQTAGCVALRRGPLLYCLEEVDNGKDLHDVMLPATSRLVPKFEPRLMGGTVVITGKALRRASWKGDELYRAEKTPLKPVTLKAIPYAYWANRQPGEMTVWLKTTN